MRRLYPPFVRGRAGIGLLLVRIVVGAAFIFHGWQKIGNPFHWMEGMPDAPPAFLQGMAVFAEVGGGAMLILGFLTPLAAFLLACDMGYALAFVHLPKGDPFIAAAANGSSCERALVYLAVAVAVFLAGPGRYALDAMLFGRRGAFLADESAWTHPNAA
jgi:putative oxidoreductase